MENAADALRMAGGVLIFVLALTISINAFTQARQGIDQLVLYSDREFLSTYVEQNKGTKRIVGAESIVPTIYRAYKENIKIKFEMSEFDKSTQEKSLYSKDGEYINYIDLQDENIAEETTKEYILQKILFGARVNDTNLNNQLKSWGFNSTGLYDKIIKGKQYVESLGVYFPNKGQGTTDNSTINKTEKKVITYSNVQS